MARTTVHTVPKAGMGQAMAKPEDRVEYHRSVEDDVIAAMKKPSPLYWVALFVSASFFAMGMALWGYQMWKGMGVSGLNNPVGWGVYITAFVFWVGIAHSGTLISAVLFLFRAKFRSAFNRSAEAMTVFAVMTAGLFPLIHLGRSLTGPGRSFGRITADPCASCITWNRIINSTLCAH